jgi:hypothetical protein
MALVYVSSSGEAHDPETLHLARYANGLRLIEREGPINPNHVNLAALKAVYERRQAAWDAANPKAGD